MREVYMESVNGASLTRRGQVSTPENRREAASRALYCQPQVRQRFADPSTRTM